MGFKKKSTKKNKENKQTRKPIVRSHTGCHFVGEATHMTTMDKKNDKNDLAKMKVMNREQMVMSQVIKKELHKNEDIEFDYIED